MLNFLALLLMLAIGSKVLPEGPWGGERLMLEVAAQGASIDFDCATGYLDGPLALDPQGSFEVKGSYRREAGPQRADGSDIKAAVYRGKLAGDSLTLTITLKGSSEPLGTWTMKKGQRVRLMKCR